VFIGRVEATDPKLDLGGPEAVKQFAEAFPGVNPETIDAKKSPDIFPKFQQWVAQFFTEPRRTRILRAKGIEEFRRIFEEGNRVTFRITKRYKGVDNDAQHVDIWTENTSCGARFIKGETYLVYAYQREGGGFETGRCARRTMRVTDAGGDLAYLHFIEAGGNEIMRVFGFVTTNEKDLRPPFYSGSASQPASDLVVELRSANKVLIDRTSKAGVFTFDGLGPGDYTLTVFKRYGEDPEPLIEPRQIRISEEKCIFHRVHVPNR
jgi:hypothetical protein